MALKVMKFGGTSMKELDRVLNVHEQEWENGKHETVLAVSAFAGVTDKLIKGENSILGRIKGQIGLKSFSSDELYHEFDPFLQESLDLANKIFDKKNVPVELRVEPLTKLTQTLSDYSRIIVSKVLELVNDLPEGEKALSLAKKKVEDYFVRVGEYFSTVTAETVFNLIEGQNSTRDKVKRVFSAVDLTDIFKLDLNEFGKDVSNKRSQLALNKKISTAIAKKVIPILKKGRIPIVTGHIGTIPGGILNTIDRGYTENAAAEACDGLVDYAGGPENVILQIWKEVDGLMSADPRLVANAELRSELSYAEAAELSVCAGMKAINAKGMVVIDSARKKHGKAIRVEVRNTFNPKAAGSVITEEGDPKADGIRFINGEKDQDVYLVDDLAMVGEVGVAADILRYAASIGANIDMINTSKTSVAFSVNADFEHRKKLTEGLKKFGKITLYSDVAMISCIGTGLKDKVGVGYKLSGALKSKGIPYFFTGGHPNHNITYVVANEHYEAAIKALHSEAIENKEPF